MSAERMVRPWTVARLLADGAGRRERRGHLHPHPPTPGRRWPRLFAGLILLIGVAAWLSLAWLSPGAALAQGYAGLETEAEGFAIASPDTVISFPADHGPHPEFRIEWWYITANLETADGTPYGVQWTLFRQALAPGPQRTGWESQQFWMAHAAVTSADDHRHAETFARGGIGQAGVDTVPFHAWIDDWQLTSLDPSPNAGLRRVRMTATGDDFSYDLTLGTDSPPVLQGDRGYSRKSDAGQASHYVSQPFFEVEGQIVLDGEAVEVTGRAWLDREWSSQYLSPDQEGWDWISLHLGTGEKLMLFRLRHEDGNHYFTGNWITPDGRSAVVAGDDIRMEPTDNSTVAGRSVPTGWSIEIASRGLAIETVPLNPRSWMGTSFGYWEGPVTATGSHDGIGYLELTGY